jgi:predicted RNase H-like HicB family nuclease
VAGSYQGESGISYSLFVCYYSWVSCLREVRIMDTKLKMIYWKGDKFWVGKLLEHPEIMTQGETLEELEENLRDAYRLMALEDVPDDHKVKELDLKV